ncbi:hypothetical protein NDA11_007435 [Ustilago hordei]|nr:hypothetical protein NDA10_005408 [Ustilago hordei]KAJ1596893.1 hypothetical protein NDA11_007435 [Ustilago hordei]
MVEDAKPQAGTSARTKGGRKGKVAQVQTDNETINKNKPEVINNEANEDADSDSNLMVVINNITFVP